MTDPIHVLLVEDNPGDADLTREGLETSKLKLDLTVAVNGSQAVDMLHKRGPFVGQPTPDLILLDLNLPGLDGRAVLSDIKQDDGLKHIPVCVLTSSSAEIDVLESYNLGANSYVVKPIDFKTFQKIVRAVESFWFTVVKLPVREGGGKARVGYREGG
ncbi:MAG TPA: response regulator [Candidatus Sulfotelmatobacter sp.]|nr:response regulator [Candidatus Sulfotelmatobacter sp.]